LVVAHDLPSINDASANLLGLGPRDLVVKQGNGGSGVIDFTGGPCHLGEESGPFGQRQRW